MTNAELLQINPQHLDELRSFLGGCEFDNIEIAAKETVLHDFDDDCDSDFCKLSRSLIPYGAFRGAAHTHVYLYNAELEDHVYYCYSFVKISDEAEEHIIFKLTRSDTNGTSEN